MGVRVCCGSKEVRNESMMSEGEAGQEGKQWYPNNRIVKDSDNINN